MRREDLYLCDILEATDAIAKFISALIQRRAAYDTPPVWIKGRDPETGEGLS
jgi:hypothetical protein